MAEIASVAAGRAGQAIADTRNLRRREVRARQELDQARQARVTRQAQAAEEQAVARRRRTQTVTDERRTRLADQKLFDAQRESQDIRFSDERFEFLQAEITEETLRARALENETGPLEPLPPGEPTGTVLTAADIEARDRLNDFAEPIPGPPPADSWMGQSVGSWDGDTFVVEVTDQSDRTWFDRAGNFHGFGLRVVERYTLRGPNHIHYEATIEDDEVFTRPWTISMPLYRRMEPNAALNQFKCVEFVEELMLGHLRREPVQ